MRGTSCVETFTSLAALPAEALTLLDEAFGFFASRTWWDVVLNHAMQAGAKPAFVVVRSAGRVVAVVPMQHTGDRLSSLTTPYTCAYAPLLAPGLDNASRIAAMAAFGRNCRSAGVVRLDALPAEWDGLADFERGIRRAGLLPLRFNHFGNWVEDVAEKDWAAYLTGRTGALRETIRRRLRRADRLADARFDLLTQPDEMDRAAEAFEAVYGRSWKEPEPYPTFNVAFMRAMAACGWLRFGLWSIGADPVAVQIWVIRDRQALVLKLAHDEAFKAHSPGPVLTALMLRHLLDVEHVRGIDFGRGDDPYKQAWTTRRQQRIGILLVNPWRPGGAVAVLQHFAGRIARSLRNPVVEEV
jgi:CelD/BcsL family acetyltransferase involved in cellulose biosynthesis